MKALFGLFFLVTSIGLVGCETHVEHQWNGEEHHVQTPKVEKAQQAPQPLATVVSYDASRYEQDEPLFDPVPVAMSKSPMPAPAQKSPSFDQYLTLNSNLYLSKAGELMADLTIENNNFVSVNHITVHCEEYNMNHTTVREASRTLNKTLEVGELGYWDQVNFGYVHNGFETVQCNIANAKLS